MKEGELQAVREPQGVGEAHSLGEAVMEKLPVEDDVVLCVTDSVPLALPVVLLLCEFEAVPQAVKLADREYEAVAQAEAEKQPLGVRQAVPELVTLKLTEGLPLTLTVVLLLCEFVAREAEKHADPL